MRIDKTTRKRITRLAGFLPRLNEEKRLAITGLGEITACDEHYISVALSRYKRIRLSIIEKIFKNSKDFELRSPGRFQGTFYGARKDKKDTLLFEFKIDAQNKCSYIAFYKPRENQECIKKFIESYEDLNRRYLDEETAARIKKLGRMQKKDGVAALHIETTEVQLGIIADTVKTLEGYFIKPVDKMENTAYFMEVPGDGQPIITMTFRGTDCTNMIFNYTGNNKEIIAQFIEGLCEKLGIK